MRVEAAARELLDALDRMHGPVFLSPNAREAKEALRLLLPRDEADRSGVPPESS